MCLSRDDLADDGEACRAADGVSTYVALDGAGEAEDDDDQHRALVSYQTNTYRRRS